MKNGMCAMKNVGFVIPRRALALLVVALLPSWVLAQSAFPAYGNAIGLDAALKLINAAKLEAAKNKWNLCIAVVDTGGHLVAMERMDDALLIGVQLAADKARTANGFKRPTRALQDAVTSGFTPILGLASTTPVEGGVPIVVNGRIVGAIGVSGADANEDGQVANAALAAFASIK
jgi:glc operon protein GlcG